MKKIISILLAVLLIFSLSACSFMNEETKGKWEEPEKAFDEPQEDLKEIEEDVNKEPEPFFNSDIDCGSKSLNGYYDDDFVYYFKEFGALQKKTIEQLKGKFDFVDKKGIS